MESAGTWRHPVIRPALTPPVMQCSEVAVNLSLPPHGLQFPWCQLPVHGQHHRCQQELSDTGDKECLKAGKVGGLEGFLQKKGGKLFLSAWHALRPTDALQGSKVLVVDLSFRALTHTRERY